MAILESLGIDIGEDIAKSICKSIPHALAKYRVQKFFGKSVLGDSFYVVIDPYEHPISRSVMTVPQNRYIKKFYGRRSDGGLIGEDKVIGSCHLRIISYAIAFFAEFRSPLEPIRIVFDEEVLDKWDTGFLCIGSADSNIKTFDIEKLKENNFYSLSWDKNGGRCFDVRGNIYNIENNEDVGLIVKLINPKHTEHFFILCQGLGEWGSSGALYYLFHNFITIYKNTKGKNFCKVIRTRIDSDETAHEIAHFEAKNNSSINCNMTKKCPQCNHNMKLVKGEGKNFPQAYDKQNRAIIWSSCADRLFRYSYWECKDCRRVEINKTEEM